MHIRLSIEISASPPAVFGWIDTPERAMRWQSGVQHTQILRETPQRIGTTFVEEMAEGGKRLTLHGRISAYVPDQIIAFELQSNIHQLAVTYTVDETAGGCRLTAEAHIRWKFPMNLLSLFFGRRMQQELMRQSQAEFAVLKRLCEEEAAARDGAAAG